MNSVTVNALDPVLIPKPVVRVAVRSALKKLKQDGRTPTEDLLVDYVTAEVLQCASPAHRVHAPSQETYDLLNRKYQVAMSLVQKYEELLK